MGKSRNYPSANKSKVLYKKALESLKQGMTPDELTDLALLMDSETPGYGFAMDYLTPEVAKMFPEEFT